ncbi:hypothetical protein DL96DRAFT_1630116 [Flagelloscypha sp. PMI_526]|nr:hypothetical protein DL96DRAFT_1630116 [Flagelloscypha sp. PMI_526]
MTRMRLRFGGINFPLLYAVVYGYSGRTSSTMECRRSYYRSMPTLSLKNYFQNDTIIKTGSRRFSFTPKLESIPVVKGNFVEHRCLKC